LILTATHDSKGTDTFVVAAADPCPVVDLDEDGDGEADSTDLCPDTPLGEEVDGNGCFLSQFFFSIDVSTNRGRRDCRRSDWKNDEPVGNPKDCQARQGSCVPR
jgi:hypothetical protein